MPAIGITLRCDECLSETFRLRKNKTKHPDKLRLKKYCPRCRCHKMHTEKKA